MENWNFKKEVKPNILSKRIVKQTIAAFIILILCLAILSFDGYISQAFHKQIAYYLSSGEADWGPAIEAMVATGLWLDSIDKGAYQVMSPKSNHLFYMTIPVSGTLVREYGWLPVSGSEQKSFHSGIDIEAEVGSPIRAAADGQVIRVEYEQMLGRLVEVKHQNGISTVYANCSEILVNPGDIISQGQIIAKIGKSVSGEGQLHFEVRKDGAPVDPLDYLNYSNGPA
ncbi:MAG: M23 family metallopeptidase [Bacillota bacterium]